MADETETPFEDGSLEDMGDPIAELHDFEEPASAGFLGRVVGSLRRRKLGSEMATLSWSGFGQVFLEFMKMVQSLFPSPGPDEGETD